MGTLRRDKTSLVSDDLATNTLFWLLLGQIGSAIFGSICQLRPSNLCAVIGSSLRGAIDSVFSLFYPSQRQVHHWVKTEVPFKEIPNITSVWADGAILCIIVENAIAPNPSTLFHTEKYRTFSHVTIPTIRLGQKLAQQYLNVEPEFKLEEMDKAADPEIILRLVKYLQNVKQASKTAKLKKPFENERQLTLKERLDEAQKVKSQKPEILRKKKIIHRKRRSKTPEKTALNFSLISSTVIKDTNDSKEKAALQTLQHENFFTQCHEIKSVCEMLLIRSSRQKSLHIFNTATRILSSRNSTSQPLAPEDSEKLKLLAEEEKKSEAIDFTEPERKISVPEGPSKQEKCEEEITPTENNTKKEEDDEGNKTISSQQKLNGPIPLKRNKISPINKNWTQGEFLQSERMIRHPVSPILHNKALSPKPYSKKCPKLFDFSKTDFTLLKKEEDVESDNVSEVESLDQKDANANLEVRSAAQLPDIANLNINEGSSDGIFFARRLSSSFNVEDNLVENPLFQLEKQENNSIANNNALITEKAYKGVKARRKYFQEAAQAAALPKSPPPPADIKTEKLALAMNNETKKRYEEVKNFFKTMEQSSMDKREHFFRPAPSRRCSDTTAVPKTEPPQIKYMSCRVKKPPGRLNLEDFFTAEESHKAVKTIQKPNLSAVVASLNSAYEEQMGRSLSPYDIVREGNEEDDSESPGSPDFRVPDLVQRRVSFSQLNQEGDAGIF